MRTLTALDPMLIAEDAAAYARPGPLEDREEQADLVLFHRRRADAAGGGACRVRFDPAGADQRIDEVRAWMAARERAAFTWWLGASTMPGDLDWRLRARGATLEPAHPTLRPMVLYDEPPPAPADIDVRLISSIEAHGLGAKMGWDVGGASDEDDPVRDDPASEEWAVARDGCAFRFGAWVRGDLAACALLQLVTTGPPCLRDTVAPPWARGRGVYEALVRACWDTAVGLGTPGLVTQASTRTRPILERIGFRAGPPVLLLVDHVG